MAANELREALIEHVVGFFTASRDFNGIPLRALVRSPEVPRDAVIVEMVDLVRSEKVSLSFGSHSVNAHIKRLPGLALDVQVSRLGDPGVDDDACVYPTAEVLKQRIDFTSYNDRPFTKRLALAEAQLTPVFFDLDVLEKYLDRKSVV